MAGEEVVIVGEEEYLEWLERMQLANPEGDRRALATFMLVLLFFIIVVVGAIVLAMGRGAF